MDKKKIDYIFGYVFAVGATAAVLFNFKQVLSAFGALFSAVSPLLAGVLIAYIVDAPAEALRRGFFSLPPFKFLNERTRVFFSIFSAYAVLALLCGFALFGFLPNLVKDFYTMALELPESIDYFFMRVTTVFNGAWRDIVSSTFIESFAEMLYDGADKVMSAAAVEVGGLVSGAVRTVYNLFFGLIFSVYILSNKSKLRRIGNKALKAFLKEPLRSAVKRLFKRFHHTFRRFVFGQMVDSAILGALCFLGMIVLGIPNAAGISMLIASTSLIPVAGAYIGAGLSALILISESVAESASFLVLIILLQQVENNYIYPRVVGEAIGIDGMFVFAGVMMGAGLWGVKGMILGIPATAFIYSLFSDMAKVKMKQRRAGIRIDRSEKNE